MCFACDQPAGRFPCPYQFSGKDPRLRDRLLCLCWIALGTARGLTDEILGLVLDGFKLRDVAIEFTGVCADKLIAFADLKRIRWGVGGIAGWCLLGLADQA